MYGIRPNVVRKRSLDEHCDIAAEDDITMMAMTVFIITKIMYGAYIGRWKTALVASSDFIVFINYLVGETKCNNYYIHLLDIFIII